MFNKLIKIYFLIDCTNIYSKGAHTGKDFIQKKLKTDCIAFHGFLIKTTYLCYIQEIQSE